MDSQFQKINSGSPKSTRLHRHDNKLPDRHSETTGRKMDKNLSIVKLFSNTSNSTSKSVGKSVRIINIPPGSHISRETICQAITNSSELSVDRQGKLKPDNPCDSGLQKGHKMVDNKEPCYVRSSMETSNPRSPNPIRFIRQRMGRIIKPSESFRKVVPRNSTQPHKPQRIICNLANTHALRTPGGRQVSDGSNRQSVLSVLHQQTRRNQISSPAKHHDSTPSLVQRKANPPESKTYSRPIQCYNRSIVQERQNNQHRMVNKLLCDRSDFQNLGQTDGRPFCHTSEQQNATVLFPCTRSPSPGDRQPVSKLEQLPRVRVPSPSSHTKGTGENSIREMSSDSDSSCMVIPSVVSQVAKSPHRLSKKNKKHKKAAKTTHEQSLPHKSRVYAASRLEIIRECLGTKGFSEEASIYISERCRTSTNKLYQAKWRIFCSWCQKRKIHPLKVTEQQLSDFFLYLANDLNKGLSAIQGYRSVINTTLHLCIHKDYSSSFYLNSQFKSFRNSRKFVKKEMPKWNLNLVLNALTKKPFEPMIKAKPKYVAWKAAFLTSLATASRISELNSLSHKKLKHDENWTYVQLETTDNFLAKNQDLMLESAPRSFHIPALFDYSGPDLPDRLLCPVRALRIYNYRFNPQRKKQKLLFISLRADHTKEITKNTLASWIRNTIKLAYQQSDEPERIVHQVSAHEVRGIASTLAFRQNYSLSDINRKCYWKGHSTFTSFYLKDLAMNSDEGMSLPNLVAASTVIKSKK